MGHPSNNGDDPEEFDKLIETLRATWRFEIRQCLEEALTSDETEDDEVLDDLTPRNLEELRKLLAPASDASPDRHLTETVITRMVVALCILTSVGAAVFIATGNIAVLMAILTFFTALFARVFRGG